MKEEALYTIYKKPDLEASSLIVGWNEDASKLGFSVVDYLNKKLDTDEFCEVRLEAFFPLGGVLVESDIAQFPESKFFYCQEKSMVLFRSNIPRLEWFKFLNLVLDIAERICHVKELYTVGGMISLAAHTAPRTLQTTTNSAQMKTVLMQQDLFKGIDYETPPNQRPTLSSYLLWVAMQRNIEGANLWASVPFYLIPTEDPRACRKVIDFFNKRLDLGIDFPGIDDELMRQNEKIAWLIDRFPEFNDIVHKLESNLRLTDAESRKIVELMEVDFQGGN